VHYQNKHMNKRARKFKQNRILLIVLVGLLLVALAGLLFSRPATKQVSTIPSSTSVGTSSNASSEAQNSLTNSGGANDSSSSQSGGTTTERAVLNAPWGNFVSNHSPGQNGSPLAETSVCNTTPGATCYLKFTNGAKTRLLDKKVANVNGSIIWNWDVKAAGFESGDWRITAIATLNGKTKSTVDSLPLSVK
jgi:hypothetical protein